LFCFVLLGLAWLLCRLLPDFLFGVLTGYGQLFVLHFGFRHLFLSGGFGRESVQILSGTMEI